MELEEDQRDKKKREEADKEEEREVRCVSVHRNICRTSPSNVAKQSPTVRDTIGLLTLA
jgi:hypothetical protein